MNLSDCIYFGFLKRTHGTEGQLILQQEKDLPDNKLIGEPVFVQINPKDETPVPFFVESLQKHGKGKLLIGFEDYADMERASFLTGKKVYLPKSYFKEEESQQFEWLGFKVIDKEAGEIGEIAELIENPSQLLLRIVSGENEILIPAVEDFILEVDGENKTLYTQLPPGLIELN